MLDEKISYYFGSVFSAGLSFLFSIVFYYLHGSFEYGLYVVFITKVYIVVGLCFFGSQWYFQKVGAEDRLSLSLVGIVIGLAVLVSTLLHSFDFLNFKQVLMILLLLCNNLIIDVLLMGLGYKLASVGLRSIYHFFRLLLVLVYPEELIRSLILFEFVMLVFSLLYWAFFVRNVEYDISASWLHRAKNILFFYFSSMSGVVLSLSFITAVKADSLSPEMLGGLYLSLNVFISGYSLLSIFSRFEQPDIRQYLINQGSGYPSYTLKGELYLSAFLFIITSSFMYYKEIINIHYLLVFFFAAVFNFISGSLKLASFWYYVDGNQKYILRISLTSLFLYFPFLFLIGNVFEDEGYLLVSFLGLLMWRPMIIVLFFPSLRAKWIGRLLPSVEKADS